MQLWFIQSWHQTIKAFIHELKTVLENQVSNSKRHVLLSCSWNTAYFSVFGRISIGQDQVCVIWLCVVQKYTYHSFVRGERSVTTPVSYPPHRTICMRMVEDKGVCRGGGTFTKKTFGGFSNHCNPLVVGNTVGYVDIEDFINLACCILKRIDEMFDTVLSCKLTDRLMESRICWNNFECSWTRYMLLNV